MTTRHRSALRNMEDSPFPVLFRLSSSSGPGGGASETSGALRMSVCEGTSRTCIRRVS